MNDAWRHVALVAEWLFLVYFVAINGYYLLLNAIAMRTIARQRLARAISRTLPNLTELQPPISVVVPAYNEEATIVTSVRSMLQLHYADFEIIVVNDGSRDGTRDALVREFDMRPIPSAIRVQLPTAPIRAIYRSTRYPNLRLVDKENGGKADALNAGIDASRLPLFCAVDADSILQHDSLDRVVRPFIEDHRTLASGGTIRLANGCRVSGGYLESVGVPDNWLARMQVVEYLRAFLFGRMGWVPFNAVLIISGAFGLFRKSAVVAAGGYRSATIGEDMELVVRLHRQHRLERVPYRIDFLPDPICWTEAPEDLRTLRSQRTRWQQGLMESLWHNRRLLFHPRAGAVGWLAFPATLLFEGLGPVVEVLGYVVMTLAWLTHAISGAAFAAFLLVAMALGLLLSASALLLEEMTFHLYPRKRDLGLLILAMLVENLGYRQLTSVWRLMGLLRWLRGRPGQWGEMKRKAEWRSDDAGTHQ